MPQDVSSYLFLGSTIVALASWLRSRFQSWTDLAIALLAAGMLLLGR